MAIRIPKRAFHVSIVVLAGLLLLAGVSLIWPGREDIWESRNTQAGLVLRVPTIMLIYTTSDDPAVFPALWNGKWQQHLDDRSLKQSMWGSHWIVRGFSAERRLLNGKGSTQTNALVIGYLPWAAIAALVIFVELINRGRPHVARWIASRRQWKQQIRSLSRGESCPSCGYDLRSTPDRCPECGLAFERKTIIVASVAALKAPAETT